MGEIDFAGLEKMMADNPEDYYSGEEAEARFEALLKQMLGVSGPRVATVDLPNGRWRADVDFDVIEKRGRDLLA